MDFIDEIIVCVIKVVIRNIEIFGEFSTLSLEVRPIDIGGREGRATKGGGRVEVDSDNNRVMIVAMRIIEGLPLIVVG